VRAVAAVLLVLAVWIVLEPLLAPVVPVLLFHHTADFEPLAAWFERHGYHALTLREFQDVVRGARPARPREVLLTFDDGDATNFSGLTGPLGRHRLHAVLFVITSRMAGRRDSLPVPALPAGAPPGADGFAAFHPKSPNPGSMSWQELREMERAGLVEAGSHTRTHTFAFSSDTLQGFASRPDWKTIQALGGDRRSPVPVFPGGSALLGPSFSPETSLVSELIAGAGRAGAVAVGRELVRKSRAQGVSGRFESAANHAERLESELSGSRRDIGRATGRSAECLAWPWGQESAALREKARAAGYRWLFTTRPLAAGPGTDSLAVPRIVFGGGTRELANVLWIYERRTLGGLYALLHPAEGPKQNIDTRSSP
jgi:peptidoglycan/xylan/chitin deacetylase (PgdA/CDA1 family)